MFEKENFNYEPNLFDLESYIKTPLWQEFLSFMEEFKPRTQFDFSRCSWEYGWNLKFKKSGTTLCTVYPKDGFFQVMVVIGEKEKAAFEEIKGELHRVILEVYEETKDENGLCWLMLPLEDEGALFEDVKMLIRLRASLH